MRDYQRRVMQEKDELQKKINKLKKFIEAPPIAIPVGELRLMSTQLGLMEAYADILTQRVARF